VLLSVVSVCHFLCLSVCQHDNSRTVRDIITTFHGTILWSRLERADKFDNGCIAVRRWRSNVLILVIVVDNTQPIVITRLRIHIYDHIPHRSTVSDVSVTS